MTDERLAELEQRCSDFGCHPVPSEVLELIAEVRRLKQARTPHVNTGGPCPCCGSHEGASCTCGETYREVLRLREESKPRLEWPGVESAVKDAERYRWLRQSVSNPAYPAMSAQYGVRMVNGEELDAAIDAAMKD